MHTGVGPVGGGGPGSPAPGGGRPPLNENETVFRTILATMLQDGGRAQKGVLDDDVGAAEKPSRAVEEKFRGEAEEGAASDSASAAAQALAEAVVASLREGVAAMVPESVDEAVASAAVDGTPKPNASVIVAEQGVVGQPQGAAAGKAVGFAAPNSARAEAAFVAGGESSVEGAGVSAVDGRAEGRTVADASTGPTERVDAEGDVPGDALQRRGATGPVKTVLSRGTMGEMRLTVRGEFRASAPFADGGLHVSESAAHGPTIESFVRQGVRTSAHEQASASAGRWASGSPTHASSGAASSEGRDGQISPATATLNAALWERLAATPAANASETRGTPAGRRFATEHRVGEEGVEVFGDAAGERAPARSGVSVTFADGNVRPSSGHERAVAARTAGGEAGGEEGAPSTDAPWGGKETAPDARDAVAPAAVRRDRESSASLTKNGSAGRGVLTTEPTRAAGRRIAEANLGAGGSTRGPAAEGGDGASVEASGVGASSATEGSNGPTATSRADVPNGVGRENVLRQVKQPLDEIVAELVRTPARGGVEQVSIRLRPEILGEIVMRIAVTPDGAVTARFFVEHAYVRQMIEQQLSELRASLSQHGLNLADASVFGGDAGLAWDDGTAADGTTSFASAPASSLEASGDGRQDDAARVGDWEPTATSIIDVRV